MKYGCQEKRSLPGKPVIFRRVSGEPIDLRFAGCAGVIGQEGETAPAGFLPLGRGRFPGESVVDAYQNHPTFRALQDPDRLKGNCGRCEYRHVCGGSRARAYAVTGDPLASEPDCVYQPGQEPLVKP